MCKLIFFFKFLFFHFSQKKFSPKKIKIAEEKIFPNKKNFLCKFFTWAAILYICFLALSRAHSSRDPMRMLLLFSRSLSHIHHTHAVLTNCSARVFYIAKAKKKKSFCTDFMRLNHTCTLAHSEKKHTIWYLMKRSQDLFARLLSSKFLEFIIELI